jgi:spore coat protein U-like protein
MKKSIRSIISAASVFAMTAIYCPASATTTLPTPMLISATVLTTCIAGIGTPIVLASIGGGSGLTGSGAVVVTCTIGTTYDILLDQGANASVGAAPTARLLKNLLSSSTMTYGLYQDAAYTAPWGNTVGTNTLHKTASGLIDTSNVYIKVDTTSANAAPAGSYADTVQISVQY